MNIVTKSEVGKMSKAESMAYIDALTTEVDRLQRRSRAHRQNIRSMSAKLELANLKSSVPDTQCVVGTAKDGTYGVVLGDTTIPLDTMRAIRAVG